MASFSHPSVGALAPASPILQQRDLTPPSMYSCHMPLRPPPIAPHHHPHPHHIVNVGSSDAASAIGTSPTANIGNLQESGGSSNNSSGYEALSAYRLPPPPLSTGGASSTTAITTPSSENCSAVHQMGPTAGGGGFGGGDNLPTSMPSYAHMSYNYAASSSNGSNSHGINSAGKQQFFASCFYSPWV